MYKKDLALNNPQLLTCHKTIKGLLVFSVYSSRYKQSFYLDCLNSTSDFRFF